MSIKIEKITEPIELGEGPHWDVKSQKLYYVDINAQKILRLDPATGKITSAYLKDGPVGVVIPVKGSKDTLIAGCGRDIVLITWDGEKDTTSPLIKKLVSLDVDRTDTRINDGKCDPAGRFWLGTMAVEVNGHIKPNRGALYSFDKDLTLKKVLSPISISNGLAWNLQNDTMYYIDSMTYQIWGFKYNLMDGSLSNKEVIFDLRENGVNGLPDGMSIDADDNLWIALFSGSAIIQIDPRKGTLLRKIDLPVDNITSLAFGGPKLDILYVTTAHVNMTTDERKTKPTSGALYAIYGLNVRGCQPTDFNCDY